MSTAGMLSPPRLASTTTSAAAYTAERIGERSGELRAAGCDTRRARFEAGPFRPVPDHQELRIVELAQRVDDEVHALLVGRARRRRAASAGSDPTRRRAAIPSAHPGDTGEKRPTGTPLGITQIRARARRGDRATSSPIRTTTRPLRPRASGPAGHEADGAARGPESGVADLAIDERRAGPRRRDRARRKGRGTVRDCDRRCAQLSPQSPHRRGLPARRSEHGDIEASDRARSERRCAPSVRRVERVVEVGCDTCAPRRSVSVTTWRIRSAISPTPESPTDQPLHGRS